MHFGWGQDSPLDAIQTVALIVMTGVLIYAVRMIGRAMKGSIEGLRDPLLVVVKDNEQIHRQLSSIWRRLEAVEERLAAAEAKKAADDRDAKAQRERQTWQSDEAKSPLRP